MSENWISGILSKLLSEYAKNPPPEPDTPKFYDWDREMMIHTDEAARQILECLDERYEYKNDNNY